MGEEHSEHKKNYSLRTLDYYQREGGVYRDLIDILQKIKAEIGMLLTPTRALNLASEAYDMCIAYIKDYETDTLVDPGWNELRHIYFYHNPGPLTGLASQDEGILECVVGVLLARHNELSGRSIPEMSRTLKYYYPIVFAYFEELIESLPAKEGDQLERLKKQLAEKEAIITERNSQLVRLSIENARQKEKINSDRHMPVYKAPVRELGGALTLETILGWARKRRHYKLADQVITMLKDLGRKNATDEEMEKIAKVEEELLSGFSELSIVNNNMGIGSNILTGIAQNPIMPMGYDPNQIMQKYIEFINDGARRENKD